MNLLFVDTAGWMMLADEADPLHPRSVEARDRWLERDGGLISTDYVLDETMTLIRVRLGIDAAERWWEQVEGSFRVLWEWMDPGRLEKARHLFFRYRDKSFSFTDCTSFVIMKEHRIRTALTSDRHFLQMGLEILP